MLVQLILVHKQQYLFLFLEITLLRFQKKQLVWNYMANLEGLVAFRAALYLLKDANKYHIVEDIYARCKAQENLIDTEVQNFVKEIYAPFTPEQVSDKIAELLSEDGINAEVKIIFQSIENLHKACPKNLGDWYFTGNYPTPGGNRVVNRAYINFFEENNERAY